MRTVSIDFESLLHEDLDQSAFNQSELYDPTQMMQFSKITARRRLSRDEKLMMTLREFVSRKTSAKDALPEFVQNI